jgi:hypothetical protein
MPSQTEPIEKSRTGIVEMRRVRHRLALVKAQFGREGVNNPSNSCRSRRLRERIGRGSAAANNYILACERRETAMERRKWRKARLQSPVICLRPLVVDPESPVICLRPAVVDLQSPVSDWSRAACHSRERRCRLLNFCRSSILVARWFTSHR